MASMATRLYNNMRPQLKAEVMALMREEGKNLLEAQIIVQHELLSELMKVSDEIKDAYNRGELR